jgi:hypothetical protein
VTLLARFLSVLVYVAAAPYGYVVVEEWEGDYFKNR